MKSEFTTDAVETSRQKQKNERENGQKFMVLSYTLFPLLVFGNTHVQSWSM